MSEGVEDVMAVAAAIAIFFLSFFIVLIGSLYL